MEPDVNCQDAADRAQTRMWQGYAAAGALATVCYFILPNMGVPALAVALWYAAISLSGAVALLVGALRYRVRVPGPWYLLGAGQTLYASADLVFYLTRTVYEIDTYPFYDDLLYLAAYPLLAAGLAGFVRARTPGRDTGSIIDSLIVAIVAALLMWVYLVSPSALAPEQSLAARVVSIAYPSMDLLLLALAVRLVMGSGPRGTAYRLIIGAILAMFVADVGYGYLELHGRYVAGGVLEALWLTVVVALGTAGLHPTMTTLTESAKFVAPEPSRRRLVVLTLTSAVAPTLLLTQYLRGEHLHVAAFATACLLLFTLTLVRMGRLVQAYEALANTDQLTGLRTRRFFIGALTTAAARPRPAVGLLLVDIDHFKSINDTYGHDGGDQVLRAVGTLLREGLRRGDVAARYGGEEFAVLLSGTDPAGLTAFAERLRHAFADAPIPLGPTSSVLVTVSVGAAYFPNDAADTDQLIRRADRRLYAAKNGGRNRVVASDSANTPEPDQTSAKMPVSSPS